MDEEKSNDTTDPLSGDDLLRVIERARREWQNAADVFTDPLFMHDADMRVIRANRAYAARTGMDIREVIGKPFWQIFPRLAAPPASCRRAIEERHVIEEELRLSSGEEFVSRAYPIYDADGRYLYSLHSLTDVTAKRQAEAEQRLLSEVVRQAAEAVILLDRDLRIVYANPAFQRLMGYTPEEILGQPLSILSVPGLPDPLQPAEVVRQVRESGSWHGEVQRRAKDGTAIPVLLRASVIRDAQGGITGYAGTYLDLREIKRAEQALRESEQRFRALIENVSDLIAVHDREGRIRYASPSIERLLGYRPEQVLGAGIDELVHPDDRAEATRVLRLTLQSPGAVYTVESRVRHQDGSYRHLEIAGRNLLDDPVIGGIVVNARDITERKQAAQTIEASEHKLRAVLEAATDGILVADAQTRKFVLWNRAICDMLGYTPAEIAALGVEDIHPPESLPSALRTFALSQKGELKIAADLPVRRKDGSVFFVDIATSVMTLEERTLLVGMFRDITERKQAGEALRESEEKFRGLVETTTDWIWQTDEHGVYTYASPQVHDLLGYAPEEIVGKTPFDLMPPGEAERMREAFKSIVASRRPFRLLENVNLHKNGWTVVLETSGTPFFDPAGAYKGYRGIDRDITDRKQAEEALRRANRALKTLSACNATMVHAEKEDRLLADMCRAVVETGGYRFAWVGYVEHDAAKTVRPAVHAGFEEGYLEHLQVTWADVPLGRGPVGRAVRSGRPETARDVRTDPDFAPWREPALKRGYASVIALPLREDDNVFAVLTICATEPGAFDAEETKLLTELADDLAFGILTLRTRLERNRLQEEHLKSGERYRGALTDTIRAIARTVEKRDPYTAGHQQRVAELSVAIGRELQLDEDRLEGLRLGATIHDIGKIYVPAEILNRPGRLSAPEFAIIKSHPEVGYDIVKDVKFPWPVAETIRCHHERLDGSGYPRGLKGEAIPLEARILAVADVVEAMASHRPYRPGHGIDAALEEIARHRGEWYDATAVDACLRLFRERSFRLD